MTFEYLKEKNLKIRPIDEKLLDIFDFINSTYSINIYESRLLEIGIGIGNKSIELSKLFSSYYGIEPDIELYNRLTNLCEKNKCKIKHFNMDFNTFVKFTDKKFNIIFLENVIHFIDFEIFIKKVKKIFNKYESGFILIKNPRIKPYNWGNKEFCKDSELFNEKKWIIFREKLKLIYEKLNNSKYLIKIYTTEYSYYFVFYLINN